MQFETKKINGVTTIFANMPDSTSTTIEIMVKAGSIYETKEKNGISHFLEHMFFKGGKKYKTAKEVSETIDSFGGEFNAYTGEEYAGYYIKSSPENIQKSLDILSDMLVNAQFPKEELETEKGVIIQEIQMYEDRPDQLVTEKRKNFFYGDNSFGRSTLGPIENIKSMKQEDFFNHKNSLYTKDNLVIVIGGKIINQGGIEEMIGKLFGDLPEKKSYPNPQFTGYHPPHIEGYEVRNTKQNHLIISAKGYPLNNDRKYTASLLSTVLGGNMSSRLFQEIREKHGLCYYIGSRHYSHQHDGIFFIKAGIEKDRREFALEAIYNELKKISTEGISSEELEKARGYMLGSLQIGLETSDELVSFLGSQYLLKGNIEKIDTMIENYKKVSLAEVNETSKDLSIENLYRFYIK